VDERDGAAQGVEVEVTYRDGTDRTVELSI